MTAVIIALSIIGYFVMSLSTAILCRKTRFFRNTGDEDFYCIVAGVIWPISFLIGLFFVFPIDLFAAAYKWAVALSVADAKKARQEKKTAQKMSATIKTRNRINELERSENQPLTTWDDEVAEWSREHNIWGS